jgi:hypothetical protein
MHLIPRVVKKITQGVEDKIFSIPVPYSYHRRNSKIKANVLANLSASTGGNRVPYAVHEFDQRAHVTYHVFRQRGWK